MVRDNRLARGGLCSAMGAITSRSERLYSRPSAIRDPGSAQTLPTNSFALSSIRLYSIVPIYHNGDYHPILMR